ncbi:MAG: hypothetical protein O3A00_24100 [Planctomycetota bacterium]|nr:hypothetical protein [Planctomycetota bacterium]
MSKPTRPRRLFWLVVAVSAIVAAWWVPGAGDEPIIGRYGAGSLCAAVVISVLATAYLVCVFVARERKVRFRLTAILIAVCGSWPRSSRMPSIGAGRIRFTIIETRP